FGRDGPGLQPDQAQGRTVVEDGGEDGDPGDVGQEHRSVFALVVERSALVLAEDPGELVARRVVGCGERGEGDRIEAAALAGEGEEPAGPVHEQGATRVRLRDERAQHLVEVLEILRLEEEHPIGATHPATSALVATSAARRRSILVRIWEARLRNSGRVSHAM